MFCDTFIQLQKNPGWLFRKTCVIWKPKEEKKKETHKNKERRVGFRPVCSPVNWVGGNTRGPWYQTWQLLCHDTRSKVCRRSRLVQKFPLQTKLCYKSLIKGLKTHTRAYTAPRPALTSLIGCWGWELEGSSHRAGAGAEEPGCRFSCGRQRGHGRSCSSRWRSRVWASRRRRRTPGRATEQAANMRREISSELEPADGGQTQQAGGQRQKSAVKWGFVGGETTPERFNAGRSEVSSELWCLLCENVRIGAGVLSVYVFFGSVWLIPSTKRINKRWFRGLLRTHEWWSERSCQKPADSTPVLCGVCVCVWELSDCCFTDFVVRRMRTWRSSRDMRGLSVILCRPLIQSNRRVQAGGNQRWSGTRHSRSPKWCCYHVNPGNNSRKSLFFSLLLPEWRIVADN